MNSAMRSPEINIPTMISWIAEHDVLRSLS